MKVLLLQPRRQLLFKQVQASSRDHHRLLTSDDDERQEKSPDKPQRGGFAVPLSAILFGAEEWRGSAVGERAWVSAPKKVCRPPGW